MAGKRRETGFQDSKDKLQKSMNRTSCGVCSIPNVNYQVQYYDQQKSDEYWSYLVELPFDPIGSRMYARHSTISRRKCTFGDPELRSSFKDIHPWTNELLTIKLKLEKYLDTDFNYMVATLFENGRCGHSFEKQNFLESETCVGILSFGAPRKVEFTQRGKVCFKLVLQHGSLLTVRDRDWKYEVPMDRELQEPRISLAFKKVTPALDVCGTSEILEEESTMKEDVCGVSESLEEESVVEENVMQEEEICCEINAPFENNMYCENSRDKDAFRGQDVCGNMVSTPSPMEKLVLQQILNEEDLQEDDTPIVDLLKRESHTSTNIAEPILKTLKQFDLSYQTSLFIELYENELRIQLIEFCAKRQSGITMDLQTFYELGRKLQNISYSLNYASDSTVVNNCIVCVVKNYTLILKQMKGLRLMKDEIRLNSVQLKCFLDCLPQMEEFILDTIFIEQLKPSISADIPCDPIPMSAAFMDLERILKEDYQKTFERLYPCEFHSMEVECSKPCKKGYYRNIENMCLSIRGLQNSNNEIRIRPSKCTNPYEKLSYKNMMTFSPAIKMLCHVPTVAEQFLSRNMRLSNVYNFKRLYQELFLTQLERCMFKRDA